MLKVLRETIKMMPFPSGAGKQIIAIMKRLRVVALNRGNVFKQALSSSRQVDEMLQRRRAGNVPIPTFCG
jgi:hypothetical protein